MIQIDDYVIIEHAKENRLEIILPQTEDTLMSTALPISKRRKELDGTELSVILTVAKTFYERKEE